MVICSLGRGIFRLANYVPHLLLWKHNQIFRTNMILYTEKDLLAAYSKYVKALKDITNASLRLRMIPSVEEFRLIYESELENNLWDEMDNDEN